MSILNAPGAALAWLGRQGTRAVAALVFLGIAVPPAGALLRPYVGEAIFVLLAVAFMRLDPAALRAALARPRVAVAAIAWTTLVVPALIGTICLLAGVEAAAPGLFLALMLQAMASPMMAAPALASPMGLDATLALITLVAGSALLPFTAPLFASLFLGGTLPLSPVALGLELSVILAGSAAVGVLLRRIAGAERIGRRHQEIDGINILVLYVFVAAVMGNVAGGFLAAPWRVAGVLALAFAVFLGLIALSALAFAWAGRRQAMTVGFVTAQRNMGLMLAATAGTLPEATWLYFALGQFPIYLSPQLLKPLARSRPAAKTGG